jgi:hypothetical protein
LAVYETALALTTRFAPALEVVDPNEEISDSPAFDADLVQAEKECS